MRILSVDPGIRNLGYCIAQVDQLESLTKWPTAYDFLEYGVFDCQGSGSTYTEKLDEEAFNCMNFFEELFDKYNPTHVAWELPPTFGGMGQQTRILSNVTTLKILVWKRNLWCDSFTPITMKSIFTGMAKAGKKDIKKQVTDRWPELDQKLAPDVYDAIGICVAAVERNTWSIRV